MGSASGILPPLFYGGAVVVFIFDDRNAAAAEQIFLPLLSVDGHVNDNAEAQLGAHDADAHT